MIHPRVASAFAGAAADLGAALVSRAQRLADPDLRRAARDAHAVLVLVRADQDDAGARLAGAFAALTEALRLSPDQGAEQVLVDAASSCSPARLAAAPDLPPSFASGALALPAAEAPTPAPRAASRRQARAAAQSVRLALSVLAACDYARLVIAQSFPTRDAAQVARSQVSALIEPLLDHPAIDETTFRTLAELQGVACRHLAETAISLKPIIRVATAKPLPACLLAWQLYGDTTRAGELVTRNRVATPCFMPTVFEAVAP